MAAIAKLSDGQWFKIRAFLRTHPRAYIGKEADCRLFVEAVHWIMCTGAQWRFLPQEYGYWNSVYKRFARWCDHSVWEEMHQHFVGDPEMENLILDSLIVQARPTVKGLPQKTVDKMPRHWDALEAVSPPKFR